VETTKSVNCVLAAKNQQLFSKRRPQSLLAPCVLVQSWQLRITKALDPVEGMCLQE